MKCFARCDFLSLSGFNPHYLGLQCVYVKIYASMSQSPEIEKEQQTLKFKLTTKFIKPLKHVYWLNFPTKTCTHTHSVIVKQSS